MPIDSLHLQRRYLKAVRPFRELPKPGMRGSQPKDWVRFSSFRLEADRQLLAKSGG